MTGLTSDQVLRRPFDLETHKAVFGPTYFEAVLLPDGSVCYAVPSHQEFLISRACALLSCDRDTLNAMCPREYYFDFMTWLTMQSGGCVPVWSNMTLGPVNDAQRDTLLRLADAGIYLGQIPPANEPAWRAVVALAPVKRLPVHA